MKLKHLVLTILIAGFTQLGFSQTKKFGHINSNELLMSMPERDSAEKTLQNEARQLESALQTMSKEYETKVAEYQANAAAWSDVIKASKAKEIGQLEQRIQEFQSSAQESLERAEQELMKPLIDKAKKAIEDVAKENGYGYIFDSGVGAILYSPEGDDIMPLVKKKLMIP